MIPDLKVLPKHKHLDLVKANRSLMASLRTKVEIYHLYGHQDKLENYVHLPRDAQLNVQVTDSAQQVLQWAYEHSLFVSNPSFSREG